MVARTCWRLGCRRESPLEWHPTHLMSSLSDELMIEAWLKAKLRMGLKGVRTAQPLFGDLADERWRVTGGEREKRGSGHSMPRGSGVVENRPCRPVAFHCPELQGRTPHDHRLSV